MIDLLRVKNPNERARRAKWILDLDELRGMADGAGFVTLEDFARVRFGGEDWNEARALRNAWRLKAELARYKLELEILKTANQVTLHVDTPEIAELVELHVRRARLVTIERMPDGEEKEAALAGWKEENEVVDVARISIEYRDLGRSFAWIRRKAGIGHARARMLLVSRGPIRGPKARKTIETIRPAKEVERAIAVYEHGETVEGKAGLAAVAKVLACSLRTARRFLGRRGIQVRPPGRPTAGMPD